MAATSTSVVIPAFRSAATLRKAVASCLCEVEPEQVIVVLDGPDPNAESALRECEGVRVEVMPERRGAPACRNLGWRLAPTEYVLFLDADDYLEDCFLGAAEAAAAAERADLVFGRFAFEYSGGVRRVVDPSEFYGDFDPVTIMKKWLIGKYTPPCAILWRKSFVARIGGWDESLAKNQDGDLMYRALFERPRIARGVAGRGVYVQDDDPKRITKRHDRRMLTSQIAVLDKIRASLNVRGFDPRQELGFAYYNLARLAFTHEVDEIGESAERAARDLGVMGQPGAILHSLVATLFGLRRKQRLARIVREAPGRPARMFAREARRQPV